MIASAQRARKEQSMVREMYGGMDIMNIEETSQEEINAHLLDAWRFKQPLYNVYANALMLDYAPDFDKLHRWGADLTGRTPANTLMLAVQNMHSYMWLGWETGILNTFHTLTRNGLTKLQIMEIIHLGMIYSGKRGLGHAYRAAGDVLAILMPPPGPAPFPEGWAADPAAFDSHLDMTVRGLTEQDVKNLTDWYERNIGYLPKSIRFGIKYHPEFLKDDRRKWEVAIKTAPKQFAPYNMIRQHMMTNNREGLREAVLLGKSWGINHEWLTRGIIGSALFFTSTEGLYTAYAAVDDILSDMPR
jgi:hypothetical protein